ncbi:MAG TPA: prolyl-tRNA synthetase associated domain-containing protein [Dongiaceae bacterium]|jgi:Ala-tRNA(Pro) deacylase|nr:prolyl-tRNA synthetase associated domain-containing protein [Dongiaceae bacterium]
MDTAVPVSSPGTLLDTLAALGISYDLVQHPAVFTVEEAMRHRDGLASGAHVKNLFLRDRKEQMWLVVVPETKRVDLKALGGRLGGRLSFGSSDRLAAHLGVAPGSVTPLAVINDPEREVTLVFDEELQREQWIHCHPLVNTQTVRLSMADMAVFLGSLGRELRFLTV